MARLDGTGWVSVAEFDDDVLALDVFDDEGTDRLIAGGFFEADDSTGRRLGAIATRGDTEWLSFGAGLEADPVECMAVFDDGTGPALYIGGSIDQGNGVDLGHVAKWDGSAFVPLGRGISGVRVCSMHVFNDGTGDALYVGGLFSTAGGVPAERIARFDGVSWSAVGAGLDGGVLALTDFDDGGGRKLVAGGLFGSFGATSVRRVAVWDGSTWGPLGGGGTFSLSYVRDLLVDSSGGTETLYIGGRFLTVDGVSAMNVASFNGTSWSALGAGLSGMAFGDVYDLEFYDDGTGRALYAAGQFTFSGGATVRSVGRYDGSSWSEVGGGLTSLSGLGYPSSDAIVRALEVHDDGSGAALYAAGRIQFANGVPVNQLVRYDGMGWTGVPNTFGEVNALHSVVGAVDPGLYVAGQFFNLDSRDSHLARWGRCEELFDSYCFGDGGVLPGCTPCPCGNDALPGSGGGCINSDGRSAALSGGGSPTVASDTTRFEVTGAASNTFGLLISADNQLPAMGFCPVGSGIVAFDGLRCAGGALLRHGSRATDVNGDVGQTTPGWGPPNGPAGGLIASSGFISGQTRHFQVFYRDDLGAACRTGQNTTNGVSVTFR